MIAAALLLLSAGQFVGATCGPSGCTPILPAPPPPFERNPAAAAIVAARERERASQWERLREGGAAVFAALDRHDLPGARAALQRLEDVGREAAAAISGPGLVDEIRPLARAGGDGLADLRDAASLQQFYADEANGIAAYIQGRRSAITYRERVGWR